MKQLFVLLSFFVSTVCFSQSPTRGALTTLDTAFKPNIKMMAINRLDNLVYLWDGDSWGLVGGKPSTGSFWGTNGNNLGYDSTNYIGNKDSSHSFEIRNGGYNWAYLTRPWVWLNPAPLTPTSFGFPGGSAVFMGFRAGEGTIQLEKRGNFSASGHSNVLIGNYAGQGINKKLDRDSNFIPLSAAVMVGAYAGINAQYGSASGYGRPTFVGALAGFMAVTSEGNSFIGANCGERSVKGSFNTMVGSAAGRSLTNASFNTGVGYGAGGFLTGVIGSITITNGGSGYTSAIVTISPPKTFAQANMPYIQENPALATATITDGVITAINITDRGAGYIDNYADNFTHGSWSPPTVTITGDGTGATATATVVNASYNTYLGYLSGWRNRGGYANTAIGAGISSGNMIRNLDSLNSFFGAFARVNPSVPLIGTNIKNATAIGANAWVSQSNSIVLGDSTVNTNVAIGHSVPASSSLLDVSSTSRGVLIPRMTKAQRDLIPSPAIGLLIWQTDNTPGLRSYNGTNWMRYTETID